MFCPKCGAQNPDGAKFCKGCGAPLGGRPATASYAGAPGATSPSTMPGTMPGAVPMGAGKPRPKVKPPAVIAVVAIVAVLAIGLATSWFGLAGSKGLKAGTYYLRNSDGITALTLSVHNDGIVGVSEVGGMTIEGKSEVTNSNGHLVMKLSDLRGSNGGGADLSGFDVTVILPSGLGEGSYVGDYAFAAFAGSDKPRGAVLWFQLRDDGSASYKQYVCGVSSGGNGFDDALNAIAYGDSLSDKDPNVLIGSIANGTWSDDQAKKATWRADDSGDAGFDIYDTSGRQGMSGSFEPFK